MDSMVRFSPACTNCCINCFRIFLKSTTIIEMPIHPKTEGASYNCFKDCPICWSITERNIQRMRAGETIVLCTWRELLTFGVKIKDEITGLEQGACPLCASLARHIMKFEGSTVSDSLSFA